MGKPALIATCHSISPHSETKVAIMGGLPIKDCIVLALLHERFREFWSYELWAWVQDWSSHWRRDVQKTLSWLRLKLKKLGKLLSFASGKSSRNMRRHRMSGTDTRLWCLFLLSVCPPWSSLKLIPFPNHSRWALLFSPSPYPWKTQTQQLSVHCHPAASWPICCSIREKKGQSLRTALLSQYTITHY